MLPKELSVLFDTLAEIQEILYMDEGERTSNSILWLYNLTFLHALAMKNLKRNSNQRKLFGQYYHVLICHAPQQLRIIALTSWNTENEDRQFNFLKTISAATSNHHPDNVLANAFLRLQIHQEWKNERPKDISDVEAKITKAYSGEIHLDTLISYDTILGGYKRWCEIF